MKGTIKEQLPGRVVLFWAGSHRGLAEHCVEWAEQALMDGVESPTLSWVAGLTRPYSASEVEEYLRKVVIELGIEVPTGMDAIYVYARELATEMIESPDRIPENLRLLGDLALEYDDEEDLQEFSLLRWAYDDLQIVEYQDYWPGMDRNNYPEVVARECRTWLANLDT